MKIRIITLTIVLALSVGLIGCSSTSSSSSSKSDDKTTQKQILKNNQSNWLTLNEMLASPNGTFVERDGSYLCLISSEEGHYSEDYLWTDGQCYYHEDTVTAFEPLFSFEPGDRIVSTEEDFGISFYYIEDEGFCGFSPDGLSGSVFNKRSNFDDYDFGDGNALEEIEGTKLGSVNDEKRPAVAMSALESQGIKVSAEGTYYAPEIMSVEGGYFEGTKWVKKLITFDTPYIDINSTGSMANPNDKTASALIQAEKTKDGYFIYDYSDLVEPGSYLMGLTHGGTYKVVVQ